MVAPTLDDRRTKATFDLFKELGCFYDRRAGDDNVGGSRDFDVDDVDGLIVEKMMARALDCLAAVCEAQRLRVMFQKPMQLKEWGFPMTSEEQVARNKVFREALNAVAKGLTHDGAEPDDPSSMKIELLFAFPDSGKLVDGRGWLPMHWAVVVAEDEESDMTELDILRMIHTDSEDLTKHHLDAVTGTEAARGILGYTPAHMLCGMEMTEKNMSLVRLLSISNPWAFTRYAVDSTSGPNGFSALHMACWGRNRTEELLRLLVQLDPLQMKSFTTQGGPLGLLCQFSDDLDDRLLECLLEVDSSVEVVYDAIRRCFPRRSTFKGRVRIVAKLLKANPAAAQHKDEHGRNLAHQACLYSGRISADDCVKILKLLLARHKDALKEADNEGRLPAHCAADRGPVQVLDLVLGEYPHAAAVVDNESRTLLHLAVMFGRRREAKARLLCARYPGMLLQRDDCGHTPVLTMTHSGIEGALVRLLCEAGGREAAGAAFADPNNDQHVLNGRLPLHWLIAFRNSMFIADPLSPWADALRLLLRLYPEAAGSEGGVDYPGNPLQEDDEPRAYRKTPYQLAVFRKLPAYYLRLLLRAAPHLDPAELRRLDWAEWRLALMVASALAAKKPTSLFANKDLVRYMVSFL